MKLREYIDKLKFDSRMIDINLKAGRLEKSEYEKQMKALPDLSNQVEKMTLEDDRSNGSYTDHFNQ